MSDQDPIVKKLAFWGIPLSFGVLGLKLLAWWVTGSVALLSDGLESTVNVVAASLPISSFAMRRSRRMRIIPMAITRPNIFPPCSKAC